MGLFQELRPRKVIRVAVVYALTAWLLVQVTVIPFPTFDIPECASRFVVIFPAIGLPVALILILSWAFEPTLNRMRHIQPALKVCARLRGLA